MNLSRNTRRAVRAYGIDACMKALHMHEKLGYGASGISFECSASIKTTNQADAAINAGREIQAAVLRAHMDAIAADPSLVSCLPATRRH